MIDLLAMLALPGVPLTGEVPIADAPLTEGDLTDFSAVLAQVVAQVIPSPLAPTTPPTTPPTTTATPVTPKAPTSAPPLATCDVPSNISSPSITSSRVVAVLPVPRAFAMPIAVAPVDVPMPPDAQVAPVVTDGAGGHPVAPATPQALPVTDTDVPEREGAPATAVLPEPASKALEQPAALGVLGSDRGDGNVQRRDTPPPPPAARFDAPSSVETPHVPVAQAPVVQQTVVATAQVRAPRRPEVATDGPLSVPSVRDVPAPSVESPHRSPDVIESREPVVVTPVVVDAEPDALPVRNEAPDLVVMPTIGEAEMPVDAPEPSASPMATATAAQASARAEQPNAEPIDRPTRDRHVNGVAAPLRRAIEHAKEQRDGDYTMTVRLDPPELGTVRIRVVAHGEQVHVSLHTELADAKAALQNKQQDIAELLRHEGFSLDGFDVDTSDRRSEQQQEQRGQARRTNAHTSDTFAFADGPNDDGALRL